MMARRALIAMQQLRSLDEGHDFFWRFATQQCPPGVSFMDVRRISVRITRGPRDAPRFFLACRVAHVSRAC
jgi:hypothetical protein